MKKCIIYGAGEHAEWVISLLVKDGYEIIALCDSDRNKIGCKYGDYCIVDKKDAIDLCKNDNSIHVFIGVIRRRVYDEILDIVKRDFPGETVVIESLTEIMNRVQKVELEEFYRNMQFKWDVNMGKQFREWIQNIDSEVDFWLSCGLDKECDSAEWYERLRRMNRKEVLFSEPDLERIVKDGDIVMDIGCALVSRFGEKLSDGGLISLIPVDPLAYYYNHMNERDSRSKKETYFCRFGMFELISDLFGSNYADAIYIRNAMDHSFDPFRGLISCLDTLKIGGTMKLQHQKAEAVHGNWTGLHKWNLDCINGSFVIWNRENAVNVSDTLKDYAEITVRDTTEINRDDQWIDVIMKKTRDIDSSVFFDMEDEKKTLCEYISVLFERLADDEGKFLAKLAKVSI